MLQPLQSVCQPSLIQTEIFLSVGSLLSVKGAPPPPQNFDYMSSRHAALSSRGNSLDVDGDARARLQCDAANVRNDSFYVFSELCDERF